MTTSTNNPFYIADYESGSTSTNLPLWGSHVENPLQLEEHSVQQIEHLDVTDVPGAFQLLNVFSKDECETIIRAAENMGYTEDAAVSLGRHIRHNMNLNWITDNTTERSIWKRVAPFFNISTPYFLDKVGLGLNQRFRFYRYEPEDFFGIHTDGAWPGSRIIDGNVVTDAFGDRYSLYTCLIFLSDDFVDGETQFLVNKDDPTQPAKTPKNAQLKGIRTPAGGMLCFPHGSHPLHCLHASQKISSGIKYIIRTDILFSL
ncbi:MAG: oxidoreductase [Marinomonas colpomeniae]